MTSMVDEEIARYREALDGPERSVYETDALYHAQWYLYRHTLIVMDLAMEHAGLLASTRREIIREVLLGGPNEAEALERVREQRKRVEELMRTPPEPIVWPMGVVPTGPEWDWLPKNRGKPVY